MMRKCNTTERTEPFTMFPTVGEAINYAKYETIYTPNLIPTSEFWPASGDCCNQDNFMSRL